MPKDFEEGISSALPFALVIAAAAAVLVGCVSTYGYKRKRNIENGGLEAEFIGPPVKQMEFEKPPVNQIEFSNGGERRDWKAWKARKRDRQRRSKEEKPPVNLRLC